MRFGVVARITTALTLALVALLAAGGGWAAASRTPSRGERAAIVRSVTASRLLDALPRGSFDVTRIRISTVRTPGRLYGRVRIVTHPAAQSDLPTGIVRRLRGHWRLINLGTSGVGCGLPARVRTDLGVADGFCP